MMSMGSGKTIVEFFSAEMELSVWRYRSCGGERAELHTHAHMQARTHTHTITISGTSWSGRRSFRVAGVLGKSQTRAIAGGDALQVTPRPELLLGQRNARKAVITASKHAASRAFHTCYSRVVVQATVINTLAPCHIQLHAIYKFFNFITYKGEKTKGIYNINVERIPS